MYPGGIRPPGQYRTRPYNLIPYPLETPSWIGLPQAVSPVSGVGSRVTYGNVFSTLVLMKRCIPSCHDARDSFTCLHIKNLRLPPPLTDTPDRTNVAELRYDNQASPELHAGVSRVARRGKALPLPLPDTDDFPQEMEHAPVMHRLSKKSSSASPLPACVGAKRCRA